MSIADQRYRPMRIFGWSFLLLLGYFLVQIACVTSYVLHGPGVAGGAAVFELLLSSTTMVIGLYITILVFQKTGWRTKRIASIYLLLGAAVFAGRAFLGRSRTVPISGAVLFLMGTYLMAFGHYFESSTYPKVGDNVVQADGSPTSKSLAIAGRLGLCVFWLVLAVAIAFYVFHDDKYRFGAFVCTLGIGLIVSRLLPDEIVKKLMSTTIKFGPE
jgi:hypothetical protein